MANWHGGKGSKRSPEDKNKFDENYEKIFGKKPRLRALAEEEMSEYMLKENLKKNSKVQEALSKKKITEHSTYFDSEFEEECREQYGDNMPDLKDSNEFRKISEETGEGDLSS